MLSHRKTHPEGDIKGEKENVSGKRKARQSGGEWGDSSGENRIARLGQVDGLKNG